MIYEENVSVLRERRLIFGPKSQRFYINTGVFIA